MNNNDINFCGEPNFATCIRYEQELPTFTKIVKSCVNLDDTTKDIYTLIGEIKGEIPPNLITRFNLVESKITTMRGEITALQNLNICTKSILSCVNTAGLSDPCGEPITDLGQILNYILNKLP